MTRAGHPGPRFPSHRLIVFAGTQSFATKTPDTYCLQLDPLRRREVEGVLFSIVYLDASPKSWPDGLRPMLDEWSQYRFLDSGVFTLMRKAQATRIARAPGQVRAKAVTMAQGVAPMQEGLDLFKSYVRFLEQYADDWDYVFNFDVDTLAFERDDGVLVPGREVMLKTDEHLRGLVGDKLVPIWHPTIDVDRSYWDSILGWANFVGVGSDVNATARSVRYACDEAHKRGVLVHGLGVGSADYLEAIPYDTADCSSWLHGATFGNYPGARYGRKTGYGAAQRWFENKVAELGYDITVTQTMQGAVPREVRREQWEIAVALMQERQAQLPQVNRDTLLASTGLYDRKET